MNKRLLVSLLTASLLSLAGCANVQDSNADGERIHGSAGVRFQSQDTSRFTPDRAPY